MAAPNGVRTNRWNQAVRTIARETGKPEPDVDAWLTAVWDSMFLGDEVMGDPVAYDRLRAWLEVNAPTAPTLPTAFERWAT